MPDRAGKGTRHSSTLHCGDHVGKHIGVRWTWYDSNVERFIFQCYVSMAYSNQNLVQNFDFSYLAFQLSLSTVVMSY